MAVSYDGATYQAVALTGVMAAGIAGGSEILQFRWVTNPTSDPKRCRLISLTMSAITLGTAFAAGAVEFDMVEARGWSAAGTGGGTLTLTGNNQKARTQQNPSYFNTGGGEIRVATTAALTAGTKTLDANPVSTLLSSLAGPTPVIFQNLMPSAYVPVYDNSAVGVLLPGRGPMVFAHQEGFVIKATVPATGTWQAAMILAWAEID